MFSIRFFFDVNSVKIGDFTDYVTLKNVDSDEGGLIGKGSKLIFVFLTILNEVCSDSVLLEGNFSVF